MTGQHSSGQPDPEGRLPLLDPETLTADQRQAYNGMVETIVPRAKAADFAVQSSDGRMIGPFNGVLYSPQMATAFLAWQAAEQAHTALDDRVRQVVILAVGAIWRADYELYAHRREARKVGLSAPVIASLAAGEASADLDPAERLAWRVATQITAERRIDDELFAAARDVLGLKGVVDLLHLVGAYQTVCGLLNGFSVPAPAV